MLIVVPEVRVSLLGDVLDGVLGVVPVQFGIDDVVHGEGHNHEAGRNATVVAHVLLKLVVRRVPAHGGVEHRNVVVLRGKQVFEPLRECGSKLHTHTVGYRIAQHHDVERRPEPLQRMALTCPAVTNVRVFGIELIQVRAVAAGRVQGDIRIGRVPRESKANLQDQQSYPHPNERKQEVDEGPRRYGTAHTHGYGVHDTDIGESIQATGAKNNRYD